MTLLHLQKTGGPYGEKNHPQRIGCNDRDVCLHSIQSPKSKYRNIREHTPDELSRWPEPATINLGSKVCRKSGRKSWDFWYGSLQPYFARLWRGVEDIAKAHDYSVVACHTGENSELEVEQLSAFKDWMWQDY